VAGVSVSEGLIPLSVFQVPVCIWSASESIIGVFDATSPVSKAASRAS